MKNHWYNLFSAEAGGASQEKLQAQADAGGPEAQNNLGVLFTTGGEFPQDYSAAAQCFRKAADQGYALAQANLAQIYAIGEGQPKDHAEATKWYRRAAQQGDAGAQFHLGLDLYRASLDGTSAVVAEARIEGFMWLQLATAQGFFNAEIARDRLNLKMSQAEFQEGNRRVAEFVAQAE